MIVNMTRRTHTDHDTNNKCNHDDDDNNDDDDDDDDDDDVSHQRHQHHRPEWTIIPLNLTVKQGSGRPSGMTHLGVSQVGDP